MNGIIYNFYPQWRPLGFAAFGFPFVNPFGVLTLQLGTVQTCSEFSLGDIFSPWTSDFFPVDLSGSFPQKMQLNYGFHPKEAILEFLVERGVGG